MKLREWGGPGLLEAVRPKTNKQTTYWSVVFWWRTSNASYLLLVAKGGTVGEKWSDNFAQMTPFIRHLRIFYMTQICDMGQTALLPFRRKACWGFFSPEKSRRFRPGANPRSWVPDASMLTTRPPKSLPDDYSTKKSRKNILTVSFTYHDNLVRIRDNRWR
jgi:hypothetical protein